MWAPSKVSGTLKQSDELQMTAVMELEESRLSTFLGEEFLKNDLDWGYWKPIFNAAVESVDNPGRSRGDTQ